LRLRPRLSEEFLECRVGGVRALRRQQHDRK
jgi:hypothetical protein